MIRIAVPSDVPELVRLEDACFSVDRINGRQFRYLLTKARAASLVYERDGRVVAYIIMLFSRATSTARIYSLAVAGDVRRKGIATALVEAVEIISLERGKTSIRAEMREDNRGALLLLQGLGYVEFQHVLDYYEDNEASVRLIKSLSPHRAGQQIRVPYYRQTLDFTCGPACLMMAMKALDPNQEFSRQVELRLWREATTIFMTSGFGGCGPQGLALAAYRRGFAPEVFLNYPENFLIDSVRSTEKKEIMRLVEEDMTEQCGQAGIPLHHQPISLEMLCEFLSEGAIPLVLISSWAIYREKFPHWLVVIGMDDRFVYAHDPLVEYAKGEALTDSLAMPIAHEEFQRMARYGRKGQRAAVLIRPVGSNDR